MKNNFREFTKTPAFVAYLTAGDGGIEHTLEYALALIEGGVTILEIGMPFSDPIADGPVIQRASLRALEAGTTLNDILWLAKKIREKSQIPLILFSYLNPLLAALSTSFFADAKKAGIDGVLVVDCPVELSSPIHQQCMQHHLVPIYVIAPTTPLVRIQKICRKAKGFLYYACRKGTTGGGGKLPDDFSDTIKKIKTVSSLPIMVGFGIDSNETAKQVLHFAEGVVVGSLFVKAIEQHARPHDLKKLALSIVK